METLEPLERYRRYLEAMDDEATGIQDDEEYIDLLTQIEVVDLLCARDEVDGLSLTDRQRKQLSKLDDLLVKHRRIVTSNLPPVGGKPGSAWWWRLHEGPEVRQQAERAA